MPGRAGAAPPPPPEPGAAGRRPFSPPGTGGRGAATTTRQYAVFTPHPYSGGCERCFSKGTCLSRMDVTLGQADGPDHAE